MRGGIRIAALVLVGHRLGDGATRRHRRRRRRARSSCARCGRERSSTACARSSTCRPPTAPDGPPLPTLYLLHGTPGTPDGLFALGVPERLDRLIDSGGAPAMIVVAPSGGPRPDSDTEWDDSVADAGARWGTFVTRDLVNAIDNDYPTKPAVGSRAIAGISMGGYGAVNLALGHAGHLRHRGQLVGLLRLQHTRGRRARGLVRPGGLAHRCSRWRSGRPRCAGSRSPPRSTPVAPTASSARTSPSARRSRGSASRTASAPSPEATMPPSGELR